MRAWELFRQAIAGAARARLRTTLTTLGIAIGCGALVSMVAFALGLQEQMEAPFRQLGLLSEIRVSPADSERPERAARGRRSDREDRQAAASSQAPGDAPAKAGSAAPSPASKQPALLNDAALAEFRAIPGVKYAYPELWLSDVGVSRGNTKLQATAVGAPREAGLSDAVRGFVSAGRFFSLDDAPEIMLNETLAAALEFRPAATAVGQMVDVTASGLAAAGAGGQFELQSKSIALRVVGVFEPPSFGPFFAGRDVPIALIPVDRMAQLPGLVEKQLGVIRRQGDAALGTYQEVIVRAESPVEVERIAQTLTDHGFDAHTMVSQLEDGRLAFLFIKTLLASVGSVAMVIAGLGIANTLLMAVLERYEEIGLYKAIGATDGDVRLLFLSEAAVLGLLGGVAGLALAGVVCWGLQWGISTYLASRGVERVVDAFHFPWWLLAGGVLFSVVVSIVSGIYPASRAAKVDPIRALRRI